VHRIDVDVPSLLLVETSRAIGDLLVGVAAHCVAGFLLDEVECWEGRS